LARADSLLGQNINHMSQHLHALADNRMSARLAMVRNVVEAKLDAKPYLAQTIFEMTNVCGYLQGCEHACDVDRAADFA
jgi:hypothetical protein